MLRLCAANRRQRRPSIQSDQVSTRSTEVALFPLADYSGRVVTDLFGEDALFDDAAQFWTLQHQAIAALRARLLAEGWAKVAVLETRAYFSPWEYPQPENRRAVGCGSRRATAAK